MSHQKLLFTNDTGAALEQLIGEINPAGVWIIADENTAREVVPELCRDAPVIADAPVITIAPGDDHKTLDALSGVWAALTAGGATRRSLVINVGGGMVTDLGGFAAATFKRGIRFINLPTTLLGAVDAAVGGKTGVNFMGLKNEIGVFREADAVLISTRYFSTLPEAELLSGYAEMIKHAIISDSGSLRRLLDFDITAAVPDRLLDLLRESVEVKRAIVEEDPHEQGRRRALNLGHTIGHALESLAMAKGSPVSHGYAVAWGLVAEMVLAHIMLRFPTEPIHRLASFVSSHYGAPVITCEDYPELIRLMGHDKKNPRPGTINFALPAGVGDIRIDCVAPQDDILAALDIFRDLFHI